MRFKLLFLCNFIAFLVLASLYLACQDARENLLSKTDFDKQFEDERVLELVDFPNSYNPGLIDWHGLVLSFRSPNQKNSLKSHLGFVRLDDDLNLSGSPHLVKIDREDFNPEDARLFIFNEQLYALYTESIEGAPSSMHLAQVLEENDVFYFGKIIKLQYMPTHIQKNWVPVPWQNELYFVFLMEPLKVIRADLETGQCSLVTTQLRMFPWNLSSWQQRGHVRGGTPLVALDDGSMLGFFHSSVRRHYFAGAYILRSAPPHFSITHLSSKPLSGELTYQSDFNPLGIIFPGGLVRRGEDLLLAYGVSDSKIAFTRVSLKRLRETMVTLR